MTCPLSTANDQRAYSVPRRPSRRRHRSSCSPRLTTSNKGAYLTLSMLLSRPTVHSQTTSVPHPSRHRHCTVPSRINQQPAVRTTGDSAVPERHMGRSGSAPLLAFINVPGTRSLRLPPHNLVRLRAHPPRRHPRTRASSRPATIWKRPSPPLPLSTPAPPLEAPAAPSPDPLLGVQNGVAARTGPLGHL